MSWIIGLKFFHYLALFLAGGVGVGNAVVAKTHMAAGIAPAPPVQAAMMKLARLGLASIILIWLTGLALVQSVYGTYDLGWAFHMKLFGATTLLAAIAYLNIHLSKSAAASVPPNPTVMKIIPMVARTSLVLVLLGIAIVTSS